MYISGEFYLDFYYIFCCSFICVSVQLKHKQFKINQVDSDSKGFL